VACGLDAAVKLWAGAVDTPIALAELKEIAASYPPRLSIMLSCFLVRRLIVLGRDVYVTAEIELCIAAGRHKQAELQVADRINVSVSTIKGHLQRLYGKLGVASRSAALARARALNLLP
jgi:DNA-binding CsgD family transcriptional regulator